MHTAFSTFSPQTKLYLLEFDLEAVFHFTLVLHTIKYLMMVHSACDRIKNVGKETDNTLFSRTTTKLKKAFFHFHLFTLSHKGKTISTT